LSDQRLHEEELCLDSCSFRTRKEEQASKNVDWSNQLKHSRKKHTALLNLTSQVGTPRQRNPPAPKVPRRNSVGVEGNQTDLSDWYSFQLRPNALFRSNMAATSAPLGVNFGQQGHNFGPTWTHLAPTSAQLGSKMAQLGPNKLDPFGSNFGPS